MKILITGIHGFLASHLARKLVLNHSVTGLYKSHKNKICEGVKYLGDVELIEEIPDLIIMCHAAISSGIVEIEKTELFETNAGVTKQIIQKFKNTRVIYISSVSVYGSKKKNINENSSPNPETDYAYSKLAGEKEVMQYSNKAVIIRFSSLYGDEMKENTLIPNYCNQALLKKTMDVWGDGSRLQNYIHVDDAVNLIEKVSEYQSKIDFPLLGVSSREYSNSAVAKIIATLTDAEIQYKGHDNSPSFCFDNSITKKILNWQSETELGIGLKNYLEWKKK